MKDDVRRQSINWTNKSWRMFICCQSVSLSVCQSISLSVYQPVRLSVCQSVSLSIRQSVSLPACQTLSLPACQTVSPPVCQSASLSVCQLDRLQFKSASFNIDAQTKHERTLVSVYILPKRLLHYSVVNAINNAFPCAVAFYFMTYT